LAPAKSHFEAAVMMNNLTTCRFMGYLLAAACLFSPLASHSQKWPPPRRDYCNEFPAPDPDSSPEVQQAEATLRRNDFDGAEALLQKAVAAKPDDYRAWFDLGYINKNSQSQPPQDAIAAFRRSVALKPDFFESNFHLGLMLEGGPWPGAGYSAKESEKYLRAATQLTPSAHPQESLTCAWIALGSLQEWTGEETEGLQSLAEASRISPNDPEPHLLAGNYSEAKHPERAISEYKKVLEVDPTSRDAFLGLDRIYERQNNYPEAEVWLRKLVAIDPDDPARLYLAQALSAEGKYDKAEGQLKEELQGHPQNGAAALELARVYAKAGEDAEAEQQFRIVVEASPQNAEAHYAFGSLLLHEKKYPEAQQELLTAIKLKHELIDAYGDLAAAANANKDYSLALQVLNDRAKMQADPPAICFLRGTTYDNLNAVPEAVEYYQEFLAADGAKLPEQDRQARERLIALDPQRADKYRVKK
jgi:tetratricopeptide (TPR) repeat protein